MDVAGLWKIAVERLKDDSNWSQYPKTVRQHAVLANTNIETSDGIIEIANRISEQVNSSRSSLRLAGRTIVIREVLNKVIDVLDRVKDVGASAASLNFHIHHWPGEDCNFLSAQQSRTGMSTLYVGTNCREWRVSSHNTRPSHCFI